MIYLMAGEAYFSSEPGEVVTVLGSCLSITMYCRSRRLGGICHVALPRCDGARICRGDCPDGFKYVDCSIRRLVRLFERHNVRRSDLEVKCFGGADMLAGQVKRAGVASVGRQNITAAERVLVNEGLNPIVTDVGGSWGRKILFNIRTGEVLLKRLDGSFASTINFRGVKPQFNKYSLTPTPGAIDT